MIDLTGLRESLDRWNSRAFLLGGLLMLVNATFVAATVVTGTEHFLLLGEVFVAAAWIAALIGLLGLYPALANRSRWLSRSGAVCAVIGVVVFTILGGLSLFYYAAGIPLEEVNTTIFIPGVLVGSVLGFILFSAASLRTDVHPRSVGILLLVPAVLVVMNILRFIAGYEAATITLVVVIGDAVAMLAIGYLLRTGSAPTGREEVEPVTDTPVR